MANYPALTEMGVNNPENIERYSMQTIKNVDILRIVYKRKKGSLLHTSKKFRFGRAQRMVLVDGGSQKTEIIHEVSPFVIKVTDELRALVKTKHSRVEQKDIILDELRRLEEETNTRIAYLKGLIEKLD
jgi:hypothetical protein